MKAKSSYLMNRRKGIENIKWRWKRELVLFYAWTKIPSSGNMFNRLELRRKGDIQRPMRGKTLTNDP
jgi:hypothetical protein